MIPPIRGVFVCYVRDNGQRHVDKGKDKELAPSSVEPDTRLKPRNVVGAKVEANLERQDVA